MLKKGKKINQYKRKRIIFILASILICLTSLFFIINNFRDNIVFFYSPSELSKIKKNQIVRVGGLIKKNSIKNSKNLTLEFILTDNKSDLKVFYDGIKPNLFREEQGMVAKGHYDREKDVFIASELLTKHDENYMPPEAKKALEKTKKYQN